MCVEDRSNVYRTLRIASWNSESE